MKTKSPFLKASQMQKKSLMTAFVLKFMLSFFVLTYMTCNTAWAQIYTENFSSGFLPTGWTIINAGSGNNWEVFDSNPYNDSYCMRYPWNTISPANTWAFTQGINMTAGNTYRVEFYQRTNGTYPENMKVTVGTAQTVISQTTTILDLPSLTNNTYTNRISSEYTCPATGTYYFAFNCYSDADQYVLYVDNIRIYETSVCIAPTIQASIGTYTNNTGTSVTVNWTRGNGTGGVIVVARPTASTEITPTSGTNYVANATYGTGSTIGTNNYVVYKGTGSSVNVTGLTYGTNYTFTVYEYNTANICYKIPGSSSTVQVGACTPTYSEACSVGLDYINNFSTTGGYTSDITNNNSNCNGNTNNYIYYSNMTVSQIAGGSFNINIQSGPNSPQGFRIWVDWNNDNDFEDTNEDVWNSGGGSTSPYTGTITIPAGTPVGTYRMRVRSKYSGTPSSTDYCSNLAYGETEDYNLSVLDSGPMTYSSSTVTQASTNNISNCSSAEPIICLQVVTNGNSNPISLQQIKMQILGTAPVTAIDKIHVYYTGASSSFQTINPFDGIGTTPATGTITISGNQQLVMGTNYFWIAYDMNTTATVGTNVDAKIITPNGIIVNGTGRTPTTVDPSGNRTITTCVPSPGGVSNSLSVWYKADNGVTQSGGSVSDWASSGGSVTGYNLTQSTLVNMPILASNIDYKYFNYNRKIRFNGTSSYLESTTTLSDGNNLIGNGAGSFFVVLSKDALDGSALTYNNILGQRFQFKPKFRIQSGDLLTGSTIDVYNPINSSYHTYFPNGEWPDDAAFITFSQGINTALNIAINSKICNTLSNSSNPSFAPSITAGLSIGRNGSYGGGEYVSSDIGEIIFYSINPSDYDKKRIDTYLSIKYGVTRGNNSGTSTDYNYVASNGTTVFDKSANTGYNNDIAGIARDDASGLNQKQSLSVNTSDILTIGLGTISGENLTNTNTFPKDRSFVVWGNNGLPTVSSTATQIPAAASKLPPGIESRIQRVWKYQNTNFIGSASGATPIVKVGFEMFGLVNYTSVGNLRLLMDDDGVDWSNAWVSNPLSQAAVQTLSRIEFPNVILEAARPYITLASINKTSTPLPVEITEFNVNCDENKTILTWTTASETNNKYFTLERSFDLKNWESIDTTAGAGNSNSIKHYYYTDNKPSAAMLYYRLTQTDFDGRSETFMPISANCQNEVTSIICYPNPFNDQLNIVANNIYSAEVEITVRSITGQIVTQQRISKDDMSEMGFTLNLSPLAQGAYSIEFKAGNYIDTQKILKN